MSPISPLRLLVLLCAVTACNATTPAMWRPGVMSGETVVDGARFRVDFTERLAEAHRLNLDFRIARGPMVARGAVAIKQVTGCALRRGSVQGDQAIVRARLDCGTRPSRSSRPPRGPAELVCVVGPSPPPGSRAPEVVLTDCTPAR